MVSPCRAGRHYFCLSRARRVIIWPHATSLRRTAGALIARAQNEVVTSGGPCSSSAVAEVSQSVLSLIGGCVTSFARIARYNAVARFYRVAQLTGVS